MSNKESSINYKKVISSISMCKNYELLGGCDISDDCLFNLHTKNAIYTHFGLTSTDEYHVSHKRIKHKYSEEDTAQKKKLIKELNLDKLESKFNILERRLEDVNDTSYQEMIECLPEEYKNKHKESYNKLVENEKSNIKDSSSIIITYTNGEVIKVSLQYLDENFIQKFNNIIKNKQEEYEEVSSEELIKTPLLRFQKKHDVEIEYLEKIRMAYYNLNFDEIYDLLSDNCFKMSCSQKDKYNTIMGKKDIIENYENLIKIAKQNDLIYQGSLHGELTYENEPILAIRFVGREKNNNNNSERKRAFSLSIRINDENLIDEINIRDADEFAGKYLDSNAIEKVKKGAYSDFNEDFKVNNRIFNDAEIELLLDFIDKSFPDHRNISMQDIENKIKKLYKDFLHFSSDTKNRLISDIIVTSGKVEYNDPNLICSDCGCRYISSLGGGFLRQRKDGEKDNKHKLSRHAYGCIITGNEYEYQCLGCGKEWKQRSVCGEKKSI